jgi:23S rRNA-/tRNA-specific pseudouridylate synthase
MKGRYKGEGRREREKVRKKVCKKGRKKGRNGRQEEGLVKAVTNEKRLQRHENYYRVAQLIVNTGRED